MNNQVYPIDAFGFPSKARGKNSPSNGCIRLIHSKGEGFISREDVKKNSNIIDKWKVTIGILVPCNGEVGIDPAKGYKAITTPRILKPGEVTTFSYLVLGVFDTETEARNFKQYMQCKFPRFMLRLTYSSMHIAKDNFMFVPIVDFTKPWTDEKIYKLFSLNEKEIELIENTMRTINEGDDDA